MKEQEQSGRSGAAQWHVRRKPARDLWWADFGSGLEHYVFENWHELGCGLCVRSDFVGVFSSRMTTPLDLGCLEVLRLVLRLC